MSSPVRSGEGVPTHPRWSELRSYLFDEEKRPAVVRCAE